MENWQFHEEMKSLNQNSYGSDSLKTGDVVKANNVDWKVEAVGYDPATNFRAVAYSNGTNLVYSFVGTAYSDGQWLPDWTANLQMGESQIPGQFHKAEDFFTTATKDLRAKYSNIYFTGHSEGGSEAVMMAKEFGYSAVTFNAYGTKDIIENNPNIFTQNPKIINYGIKTDTTFTLNDQVGDIYVFDGPSKGNFFDNFFEDETPYYNAVKSHSMDNFPSLNQGQKVDNRSQYVDLQTGLVNVIPQAFQEYFKNYSKLSPAKYDLSNNPIAGVNNVLDLLNKTKLLVTYPKTDTTGSGRDGLHAILDNTMSVVNSGFSLLDKFPKLAGNKKVSQTKSIIDDMASFVDYGFDIAEASKSGNTLGLLGTIFTGAGSLISKGISLFSGISSLFTPASTLFDAVALPIFAHTGATVVPSNKGGRNEMLAILQGGETVRTEAQEKELQDANIKKLLEAYAPLVSGESAENDPYAQVFGKSKGQGKDSKTPVLMNKTKHDEEMIIAIVADAWKSNRSGFRNILRYS